jgi:aconitate hydratase
MGSDGAPVFLRDIWPTRGRDRRGDGAATDPGTYRQLYADFARGNPLWNDIPTSTGPELRLGAIHLHRRTTLLRRFLPDPGPAADHPSARERWRSSAIR